MTARLLPLAATLVSLLGPATGAAGAVREGAVADPPQPTDPRVAAGYTTEVEQVVARYDDATGDLDVSVTFERPERTLNVFLSLARACDPRRGVDVAAPRGEAQPPRLWIELYASRDRRAPAPYATAKRGSPGTEATGSLSLSPDRRTLTGSFAVAAFAGHDWRCVFGAGSGSDGDFDEFAFSFAGHDALVGPRVPYPTRCSRQAAEELTYDALLPHAAWRRPSYYRRIVSPGAWHVRPPLCRDLTGDGDPELIVRLACCTGSALGPWAIFTHGDDGRWRMAYARVDDIVTRVSLRGRRVRAMIPSPYDGGCTDTFRFRVVTWDGERFRSRLTRRRHLGNPNPGCS